MATSKFYPFAPTTVSGNKLTDAAYLADAQRLIGNQPGVARSPLVNKALCQSTLMAATLARFISEIKGIDIDDTMAYESLASHLYSAISGMIAGTAPPSGYETVGLVGFFPRTAPPINWLRCNGAAVSRVSYANLFAVVGTTFGPGDGSTTFNLPDLRSEFIRGLDDGRGVDPGRAMGSAQKGTLVSLDSSLTTTANNTIRGSRATVGGDAYSAADYAGTTAVWALTANEMAITSSPDEQMVVRPRNVAMLACIKY